MTPSARASVAVSGWVTPWIVNSPTTSTRPAAVAISLERNVTSGWRFTSSVLVALRTMTCLSTGVSGVIPPEPDSTRKEASAARNCTATGFFARNSTDADQSSTAITSRCPIREADPATSVNGHGPAVDLHGSTVVAGFRPRSEHDPRTLGKPGTT